MGRFNPVFIELRRRSLERYLNRLVKFPEVLNHEVFRCFLQGDDSQFQYAKDALKKDKNITDAVGTAMKGIFQQTLLSFTTTINKVNNHLM